MVVLHGTGLTGLRMAEWTGLGDRGPEAGFATVFPDAVAEMWDDTGHGRADGLDDARFVAAIIERLVAEGEARRGPVFLVGLSNGAFFAERLARHGLVAVGGLALVAGTAREASRRLVPRPAKAAAVICFEGTADRLVPYTGGRARGPLGWTARRRARRLLTDEIGRDAVAAESLAADWAVADGCSLTPEVELLPAKPGDPKVHRLTWGAPGQLPVILYRIIGGGHGWPGGPQYMPAGLIGKVPRHLDATGIVLDFARATLRDRDVAAYASR
jgi:polyhydroxybutyrate depolymerase